MQMVVAFHENDIRHAKNRQSQTKIEIMVDRQQYQTERNQQLQSHVNQGNGHMRHMQLVGHQLERMLPVSLSQVLVQLNAVAYREYCVHAVHRQKDDIRKISGLQYQFSEGEYHYESNGYGPHVAREAFRLVAEIEVAEYQQTQTHYIQELLGYETVSIVQIRQRQQHRQGITVCYSVYAVHEIVCVDNSHAHDQRDDDDPPVVKIEDAELLEHQEHRRELHH